MVGPFGGEIGVSCTGSSRPKGPDWVSPLVMSPLARSEFGA